MIRHIALLTFVEGTTEEQVASIEAALARLPDRIPALRSYSFARDLGIEEVTVKLHLRKIYRKLGVRNRTQAVQLAMGMRL